MLGGTAAEAEDREAAQAAPHRLGAGTLTEVLQDPHPVFAAEVYPICISYDIQLTPDVVCTISGNRKHTGAN